MYAVNVLYFKLWCLAVCCLAFNNVMQCLVLLKAINIFSFPGNILNLNKNINDFIWHAGLAGFQYMYHRTINLSMSKRHLCVGVPSSLAQWGADGPWTGGVTPATAVDYYGPYVAWLRSAYSMPSNATRLYKNFIPSVLISLSLELRDRVKYFITNPVVVSPFGMLKKWNLCNR